MKRRLDAVLDAAISEERIVGTLVIVARDGAVVCRRAAGYAEREARRPVRDDTLFRYASMTKPIVSAAALALVEAGKLGLDDPVAQWLLAFEPRLDDGRTPTITVRHLLTHTAGLTCSFFEPEDGPYHRAHVSNGFDDARTSLDENLARISQVPLAYEPGTRWGYSVATDVLGASWPRRAAARSRRWCSAGSRSPSAWRPRSSSRSARVWPLIFSPSRSFDRRAFTSGGAGMRALPTTTCRAKAESRCPAWHEALASLRPWTASALFAAAVGAGTRGGRSAVGREAFLQRDARSVQTHHRVVRREPQLDRDATDRHTVDDHPTQHLGVFGLQLVSLDEDAPAVAPSVGNGGEFELASGKEGLGLFSELVEQDISHDTAQPRLGPGWIAHLLGTLQRSLDGVLDDLFGVDTRASTLADEGQELLSARCHRVVHRTHRASIGRRVHLPSLKLAEMMAFQRTPDPVNLHHDIHLFKHIGGSCQGRRKVRPSFPSVDAIPQGIHHLSDMEVTPIPPVTRCGRPWSTQ